MSNTTHHPDHRPASPAELEELARQGIDAAALDTTPAGLGALLIALGIRERTPFRGRRNARYTEPRAGVSRRRAGA